MSKETDRESKLWQNFKESVMPLFDDKEAQKDEEILYFYFDVMCTIAEHYAIQENKEKDKEIVKLKGLETSDSECRCGYCEDWYGKDGDFDEHYGILICKNCHVEHLKESENELKEELQQSQAEVDRLINELRLAKEGKF